MLIIGCGYIGMAAGAELVRQGHQVTGLRRTGSANVELSAAGIVPAIADVTRPESLRDLGPGYDWVVNCVSASGGGLGEYQRVYLAGTRNLISWLSTVPPQKLVYTSSTSVYGQRDGSTVDENSATVPDSATAQLLVQAEQALLQAAAEGFPAVVLRVAGIYGPTRAYWLEQVRAGTAQLDGTGERILNMIHRDDLVSAVVAALTRGKPGQVYNVVDDEPVSQQLFLAWLSAQLNAPMPLPGSAAQAGFKKRGLTNKRVSNRKIKEELGFRLRFPTFREGYTSLLQERIHE